MRLRKVKLSGFKSFVDPTTLAVPGNLVGIVGPNGCGKSNIIDAVTWVMGESSAKHLRGENLTDVIFNGSNTRQPVGQATVELVFDNSEGKLGGQYAGYSEISIKRQIDREAISTYFLNGTRCRRKDIQAIFLGTGLGPRSYAIIEQGMISRLIEAKPEELRVFIEEAAGISRYREKRRETENRMRHTRDNLARLTDLREELGNQLGHLQRQARAAERYQELKQEERRLEAELLALNWRDLKQQSDHHGVAVREHETRVEQGVATLREVEAAIEHMREVSAAAGEAHNAAQSAVYTIGAQISRLEQQLQHGEEKIQALNADVARMQAAQAAAGEQGSADRKRLDDIAAEIRTLEPQLSGSRDAGDQAYALLNASEQAMQAWQSEWDAFQEAHAEFRRQVEIDTLRVQHLEEAVDEAQQRDQACARELDALLPDALEQKRIELDRDVKQAEQAVAAAARAAQQRLGELRKAREAAAASGAQLDELRAQRQQAVAEATSLETLQSAGGHPESVRKWLAGAGLQKAPRLVERIRVSSGWETAVETVLDARLQDVCAPDLDAALRAIGRLESGSLGLIAPAPAAPGAAHADTLLVNRIQSELSLHALLHGVHAVETLREAQKLLASLPPGESVVTRDGLWCGTGWLRVHRAAADQQGQLRRAARIEQLRGEIDALAQRIESQEQQLADSTAAIDAIEQSDARQQESMRALQETLAAARAGQAEVLARLDEMARRREQLDGERGELEAQRDADERELAAARKRVQESGRNQQRLERQRAELIEVREKHRGALEQARSRWQATHEQSHGIALRIESLSSQRASVEQALRRAAIQGDQAASRLRELDEELAAARAPLADYRRQLETRLTERVQADRQLADSRQRVQNAENGLRAQEQARSAAEARIAELRSELESARLLAREAQVRLQTVSEQLASLGQQAEVLLQGLEPSATPAAWREALESAARRIQRLGPINLAAIDEFKQLSERKEYLDRQNADLTDALNTLENAIRKIDRESRTRFKETFDRLNNNLKEMFPVLFGGGHAYLELTGDDLLETGVSVMARPPGKRNSSIHLLSGGEKALTAVALVFAIFKLNPAPFCILDEVDAPLDDTNTGRFSKLVGEMSKDVQFIFITHNKITMEISQQLLGVTMQEAGVSRLVSVDMDEAVRLAATA